MGSHGIPKMHCIIELLVQRCLSAGMVLMMIWLRIQPQQPQGKPRSPSTVAVYIAVVAHLLWHAVRLTIWVIGRWPSLAWRRYVARLAGIPNHAGIHAAVCWCHLVELHWKPLLSFDRLVLYAFADVLGDLLLQVLQRVICMTYCH